MDLAGNSLDYINIGNSMPLFNNALRGSEWKVKLQLQLRKHETIKKDVVGGA